MAQAKKKDRFNSEGFPIHYESGYLRVYTNPSGELFVEDVRSGVKMRLNPARPDGLEFTTNGRVQPVVVTGTIGWWVTPRG
ncbi:hypothetical protein A2482_02550 [Candidatus Falkowbacteria bacterium RIFOXYC2_FULL_48_21]|uniref:Uncharacterized protein n=1 Tax=Candidatus Falkowbacteria bacterium RIFOXYC2_FULL_48_21 TaxID=1798005 RepID=A0A1F5TDP2_9BACT|nr:MAG: hypothetical protein A2482_02550 [Candidatus Falkowbacteria bacterium RIFOXYC2_FULL_48_21]